MNVYFVKQSCLRSVLSKYVGPEKSSAFLPVKWERSYISCAFIYSKFWLQCIHFSVYWYIHRTELINFSWLNSCISINYFCGDFLYFFKHVYIKIIGYFLYIFLIYFAICSGFFVNWLDYYVHTPLRCQICFHEK